MAETAVVEADLGSPDSPLVTVSFQRNDQRKLKFLEGEPKILGLTQICLTIFLSSCVAVLFGFDLTKFQLETPFFVSSMFIFIAGSVAIAAKNLHRPTLKACLGMEIVAALASFFNLILTLVQMPDFNCYYYDRGNEDRESCKNIQAARLHLFSEFVVIHVALFAISVTLIVYACKVVNCCSPGPKVPVITIHAAPAPQ
ncbi:membrane-spanning 4-domains subfamily A member 4A-like [Eucyclogobius newberryi]|uniref:membrane-spanning 4-domains subfamily A member 4A-like n=1 Tax=Eucyclogobius newberryi TaxID=166745 RepID=UPI003B5C83E5